LGLDTEGSIRSIKPLLQERALELGEFYLVDRFSYSKSNVAVTELAKEVLSPDILEMCRVKTRKKGEETTEQPENIFIKSALLSAIYAQDPTLLKQVFHFDKVHRQGFASMVLKKANLKNRKNLSFAKFLQENRVKNIIDEFQKKSVDGKATELQGIYSKGGRQYIFIRREDKSGCLLEDKKMRHGYFVEWIVLDFSPDGKQVNIASRSTSEPLGIADRIASAYFQKPCHYDNEKKLVKLERVEKFIASSRNNEKHLGLVEICSCNSPLRGSAKIRLTHNKPESLNESLTNFEEAIGPLHENLIDVDWIKVMYCGKRVGLQFDFEASKDGKCVVRYTDHRLNMFERRRFEQEMREGHGIPIRSTEKRYRN
jgi:hypothetical protein